MTFTSKTALLLEAAEIGTAKSISQFASIVQMNPLNDVNVKTSGSVDSILRSLQSVSKAILESAFERTFGHHYDDDDELEIDFAYDEEEDEDEDEEEEEEED